MVSSTGQESQKQRVEIKVEQRMKRRAEINTKRVVSRRDKLPAGISRIAVRGFLASQDASARRLKPMPADLAQTTAMTIQKVSRRVTGFSLWAKSKADKAKGRAKIVCSNLIMRL